MSSTKEQALALPLPEAWPVVWVAMLLLIPAILLEQDSYYRYQETDLFIEDVGDEGNLDTILNEDGHTSLGVDVLDRENNVTWT